MTSFRNCIGRTFGRVALMAASFTIAVMVVQAAQKQKSNKLQLVDFAKIPKAGELGWVEVQRRRGQGWGWQCDNQGHLTAMSQVRRGGSSAVDAKTWLQVSGILLIERLSTYTNEPGRAFVWRRWLRGTLERINEAADESGMPQWRKEAAIQDWVLCHVSIEEAQLVRSLIDESSPQEN